MEKTDETFLRVLLGYSTKTLMFGIKIVRYRRPMNKVTLWYSVMNYSDGSVSIRMHGAD